MLIVCLLVFAFIYIDCFYLVIYIFKDKNQIYKKYFINSMYKQKIEFVQCLLFSLKRDMKCNDLNPCDRRCAQFQKFQIAKKCCLLTILF